MEQINPLVLEVKLTAKDLWKFSMYHSYRGFQGVSASFSALQLFTCLLQPGQQHLPLPDSYYRLCADVYSLAAFCSLYEGSKAGKKIRDPRWYDSFLLSGRDYCNSGTGEAGIIVEDVLMVKRVGKLLIIYMDRIHAYLLPDSVAGEKAAEINGINERKSAS